MRASKDALAEGDRTVPHSREGVRTKEKGMDDVRVDSEGSLRRNLNEMNKMVHMIELNNIPKTQLHPLNNQIMRSELNSAGDSYL